MEYRSLPKRFSAFKTFAILWFLVTAAPLHAASRSVVLEWDPNPDSRVVGYNVYRAERPETFSSRPLNNELVTTTYFRDTVNEDQTYYYAVTAIGANGMESARSVHLEVNLRGNQRPYVSGGPDLSVMFPAAANLTATASDDGLPNGRLNYSWTVVSGSGVSLVSREAATAQAFFLEPGVYTLRVTASDGQLSASDDVVVNVYGQAIPPLTLGPQLPPPNQRPVVSAGADQTITLPSAANLTATATDDGLPKGQLSYWWTVVNGSDVSLSKRDSGAIQAAFAAPGVYTLRVTATDGQLSADDDVVIRVQSPANPATAAAQAPDYLKSSSQPASTPTNRGRDENTGSPTSVAYGVTRVQHARIHTVFQGSPGTEIALGNSNSQAVAVHFTFADETGASLFASDVLLPPSGKTATYQPESPLRPQSVDLSRARTFTFSASAAVDTVALRTVASGRGELLTTSLPVADLDKPLAPVILPFLADGGGWQSQIQLVNPSDSGLSGMVRLFPSLKGSDPDYFYDIPPRSAVTLETAGTAAETHTAWAQVIPMAGTLNPSGSLILSHKTGASTTSLGTVFSAPATSSQSAYVETSGVDGQPGSVQTSLSIANPNSGPATIVVQLLATNGALTQRRGTLTIAPREKVTFTLNQLPGMAGIESPFKGMIRIDGDPVSAEALYIRYNSRAEAVVTSTLPTSAGMMP